MDWLDKPQNYKGLYPGLYGILQLLRSSHLNNFLLKTLKLGWVAFHSVTFHLKCLNFSLINIRNSSQSSHVSAIGCSRIILVPRGRAPFGQHQESRPLARSMAFHPRQNSMLYFTFYFSHFIQHLLFDI